MKTLLFIALFLFVWPFSSGGKTFQMTASSIVPAASATVKAKTDHQNVILDIKVSHLAKPSKLSPPASAYIVWIHPSGETTIKQGSLHIDDNLKGELKAVTTSKNFEVLITAEHSLSVTAPTGPEVLRAHVDLS